MTATHDVKRAAQRAEGSSAVEHGARLGLAARTLVWTTIGVLALSVALGGEGKPDQSGALRTLSDNPFGAVLLAVLALGFLAYALYRALTAAVGYREKQGGDRAKSRAKAGVQAVLYLAAALTSTRFLLGRGQDSEQQTDSMTARVMDLPAGRWLVGLAGVVVVVVGLVMAWRALKRKHEESLEHYRMPPRLRRPAVLVGVVGLAGRGLVIALVGGFLVDAAARFDPQDAKGLDATLQTLAAQPFGTVLLLLAAAALLAFGVWSLVETVWRDV